MVQIIFVFTVFTALHIYVLLVSVGRLVNSLNALEVLVY